MTPSDYYDYYAANDMPSIPFRNNSMRRNAAGNNDMGNGTMRSDSMRSDTMESDAMESDAMESDNMLNDDTESEFLMPPAMEEEEGAMPVIPLPNPGEGGPVYDGGESTEPSIPSMPSTPSRPTIPSRPTPSVPSTPSRPTPSTPTIPLPNPGEGGPVYGGNMTGTGGFNSIITVIPRPIVPCFFCNSNTVGQLRFLNAATGYNPFRVSINNRTILSTLDYAEVSQYGRVSAGMQTVTVLGQNGYVYLSKQMMISANAKQTFAIVNTAGGLDLAVIADQACGTPGNASCLRVCNLSYNSGPVNLILSNGFVVFRNLNFMDVSSYKRLMPGRYLFFVSQEGRVLVTSPINVQSNSQYTIYIFNWNNSPDMLRTLVVEDRTS